MKKIKNSLFRSTVQAGGDVHLGDNITIINESSAKKDESSYVMFLGDDNIVDILKRADKKRLEQQNHLIPLKILIDILDGFFNRLSFRGENKIEMCTHQRWSARVFASDLTKKALLLFRADFMEQGTNLQKSLFNQLIDNITQYTEKMTMYLYENRKIDISIIAKCTGKDDFIVKFDENLPISFKQVRKRIIMNKSIKDEINLYLKGTLSCFDNIKATVQTM